MEVYEAREFKGELIEEHPKAKPNWISDSNLANVRMYQGDRRILELISQEGVFEVVTQYDKEELIRFDSQFFKQHLNNLVTLILIINRAIKTVRNKYFTLLNTSLQVAILSLNFIFYSNP